MPLTAWSDCDIQMRLRDVDSHEHCLGHSVVSFIGWSVAWGASRHRPLLQIRVSLGQLFGLWPGTSTRRPTLSNGVRHLGWDGLPRRAPRWRYKVDYAAACSIRAVLSNW